MGGIALFIVSEVFFFVRFFWAFFHSRLSPNIEVGSLWPPFGVKVFNPFQVPLLNTIFHKLSKDSLSLLCWEYISQYYRVWSIMRQVLRLPIEFTVQLFSLLQDFTGFM